MIPKKPTNVTWTDEQWEAIYEDNKNIIVSAGAGSGKTAVLTERVIRKLKDGVNVNELLILTFTKAAAGEMADRIRKKIKKEANLKEQLNLLDSAYITTFDSFALSIVKRYHYLLNVSSNIGIIDSNVIEIKKMEIMDELFLEYYEKQNELFLKMIKSFCTKDDNDIRKLILNISNKLDLLSNKKEYLEEYLNKHFNKEKINKDIKEYVNLILDKKTNIKRKIEEISYYDNEFATKLEDTLSILNDINNYDDLVSKVNIKLPQAPRGSDEELKNIKTEISDTLKEIKALTIYQNTEEIINSINLTKDTISIIIQIILEFTKRVMTYKQKNNSYEFNDIAIMAINIVKNNIEVREELKTYFKEIMIDEYQDTNDLQEEFISMISNHNVYMVGDIKQSIYRFRNANPYIFKNKYDNYSTSITDKKIDLNKNFRSRNEVLEDINTIFTLIMDDEIGGADYLKSHQMIFGNKAYLKENTGNNNNMEIYEYNFEKEKGYTKEEIEAFIIANDIKNKLQNNYLVFDKDNGNLRKATYSDFSIIMDRATTFDLYKKIFNYLKIPVTLLKDEKMNDEDDIKMFSNLIRFVIKVNKKEFDTEFKYLFTSIMRSNLLNVSDEEIFEYFYNNTFKDSNLYKKALIISTELDNMTIHQLLDKLIVEFNYYESLLGIGNIRNGIVKMSKLLDLAYNLEGLGYNIEKFSNYLSNLLDTGLKMEYKIPDTGAQSVKIMTIHKSKGLEYPVCYFSGLYKNFNVSDLKEKFLVDKDYGLIVPYFEEGIGNTIYKELLKQKYLKEEISEKIRLFYVAATRAREKMIFVEPISLREDNLSNVTVLDNNIKIKYRNLSSMLDSIRFRIESNYRKINIDDINLTKDYAIIGNSNYKDNLVLVDDTINVEELMIDKKIKSQSTFSKKTNKLITKDKYKTMQLGTKIHEYLEYVDFKNINLNDIEDEYIKSLIIMLINNPIMKDIKEADIYQEYEFIYESNDTEYHGVIDLMLEYDDYINIIDYKLKNTLDDAYINQLKGYKDYISQKTNKKINLYLYSIINGEFNKIN